MSLKLHDQSLSFDEHPAARYAFEGATDATGVARFDGILLREYDLITIGLRPEVGPSQWIRIRDHPIDREVGEVRVETTLEPTSSVTGVLRTHASNVGVRYEVAAVRPIGPSYLAEIEWRVVERDGGFKLPNCPSRDAVLWVTACSLGGVLPAAAERLPILVHPIPSGDGVRDLGEVGVPELVSLAVDFRRDGAPLETGRVFVQRKDYGAASGPTVEIRGGRIDTFLVPEGCPLRLAVDSRPRPTDPASDTEAAEFSIVSSKKSVVIDVDDRGSVPRRR